MLLINYSLFVFAFHVLYVFLRLIIHCISSFFLFVHFCTFIRFILSFLYSEHFARSSTFNYLSYLVLFPAFAYSLFLRSECFVHSCTFKFLANTLTVL